MNWLARARRPPGRGRSSGDEREPRRRLRLPRRWPSSWPIAIEVEVRGWSRGEIELTVDGEGVDELTADRDEPLHPAARGGAARRSAARSRRASAGGSRCATRSRSRAASARRAAATVAGLVAGNALLGEPLDEPPTCSGSRTEIEGHPDNAAAALLGGFTVAARDRRRRSRRSGSTRRATCGPCCSSRSCASRPPTMRGVLPEQGPARRRGREPDPRRGRRRGDGDRPVRPAPLSSPWIGSTSRTGRRRYPQLPPARRRRARTRARSAPACRGAGSTIIAFTDTMSRRHPPRIRVPGGVGRHRPARPDRGRRAAEHGRENRLKSLVTFAGRCGRLAAGPARSGAVDSVRTLRRRWATSSRRSARGSPAS